MKSTRFRLVLIVKSTEILNCSPIDMQSETNNGIKVPNSSGRQRCICLRMCFHFFHIDYSHFVSLRTFENFSFQYLSGECPLLIHSPPSLSLSLFSILVIDFLMCLSFIAWFIGNREKKIGDAYFQYVFYDLFVRMNCSSMALNWM